MKVKGVYSILNLKNGKMYIGSSIDIENRLFFHFKDLINDLHFNKKLQRAFNQSKEFFVVNILYRTISNNEKDIRDKEEFYIKFHNSVLNGYNISYKAHPFSEKGLFAGENHYMYGKHLSKETKEKISNTLKGKYKHDIKARKRISERFKGKALSSEHKEKISKSNIGKHSWEKENHPMYGKRLSEEHKNKISKSVKKSMTPELKEKLRISASERIVSEETREKMSKKKIGSLSPAAVLNEELVKEICLKLNNKIPQKKIAEEYNVSFNTIRGINSGSSWKHVSYIYLDKLKKGDL